MKPRQPSRASENGGNSIRLQIGLGDAARARPRSLRRSTHGGGFSYAGRCPEVQGVLDHLPAGRALRLRALLRSARGELHARRRRPRGDQAPHPGGARTRCGATRTSSRWRAPPRSRAAHGLDAAGEGRPRLAKRLGLRELYIKNETANPTHSFKDRVVSVALARAQELGFQTIACASTGNLANAVSAHAAAAGLESYVLIPADLEREKIIATGAYGTNIVAIKGNYDAVNRLCTELVGRAPVGVREHQPAALLRRGLQDARVRDRRAARLGAARTAWWRRSPPARCSRRSRAASASSSTPGWSRASCRTSTAPRRSAARRWRPRSRRGHRRLPPGQAGHDRQVAGHRQPGRRPVRGRAGAPRPRGGIDSVTDDEIRAGIRLLAETTGIFTETAGGVTTAVLAKLAERGDIDPRRARRRLHHRRRAEDARRGRGRHGGDRDRAVGRRVRRRVRAAARSDGGHGQAPDPAARRRRRRRLHLGRGSDGGGGARGALRRARRAARAARRRRRRAAPLRQRVRRRRGHPLPRRARHAARRRRRGHDPARRRPGG